MSRMKSTTTRQALPRELAEFVDRRVEPFAIDMVRLGDNLQVALRSAYIAGMKDTLEVTHR